MKIEVKLYKLILGVILVIAALSLIVGLKVRRERDNASEAVIEAQNQLKDTVETYETYIDGQKKTISQQKTIIMHKDQALQSGLITRDKLRAVNLKQADYINRLEGRLEAVKDSLALVEPEIVYITKEGEDVPHLRLPHELNFTDDYLSLDVNIRKDLTWGFDISSDIGIDVLIGERRAGFLQREPSVSVVTDNPYFNTLHVQSVKVEKRPLLKRPWAKLITHGLAFSFGVFVGGR